MTHTDQVSVLSLAIQSLLTNNKTTLGLADVLFGNQTMIPNSPTAVVIPGPKRKVLAGVAAPGGRTMNTLIVYIDVQNMRVGVEATERLFVTQLAETVETFLNKDTTVGGIVIHGFVEQAIPGETFLQNGEFRRGRLVVAAQTKTYLST